MELNSKSARRYDVEFKENAVALVPSGRTPKEVARDLRGPPGCFGTGSAVSKSAQG